MEDEPLLERWLLEHLGLDLSVDVSSTLLNIEGIGSTTASGTHHKFSCLVLVTFKGSRILIKLEMPLLLLLNALLILLEDREQVLALLNLFIGISVHNLSKVLH